MGLEGVIYKGYGGFYYVWDGQSVWECALRGKLRTQTRNILVGERVVFSVVDEDRKKAVIEQALPRRNELIRPAVANVDLAVIVVSFRDPLPDLWLLDRLLIMVQAGKVRPVICFNKADLVTPREREISEIYGRSKFPILVTSSKRKWGLAALRQVLSGYTAVFAGASGVGKSSLVNALEPGLSLKTGSTGEKLARGRHTTRHAELIRLSGGGLLADTPGFSRVFLPEDLKRESLVDYYPDFLEYKGKCRFKSCLHGEEPQCAVREAVEKGLIDTGRYQRYRQILQEVIAQERRH